MRSRYSWLALAIALTAALCGCADGRNIDEQNYPLALALDVGESAKLRFSALMPQIDSSSGKEDSMGQVYAAVEADNIYEALDLMDAAMPFKGNYVHVNSVIFSKELAESGDMEKILIDLSHKLMLSQTTRLLIANGKAMEFMNGLTSDLESNFAKRQKIIGLYEELLGFYPSGELMEFTKSIMTGTMDVALPLGALNKTATEKTSEREGKNEGVSGVMQSSSSGGSSGSGSGGGSGGGGEQQAEGGAEGEQKKPEEKGFDAMVAGDIQREGGGRSEIFGAAVFDGPKMVGTLNGAESKLLLMGRGEYLTGFYTIGQGDDEILGQLSQTQRPKIKVDINSDGNITVNTTIYLELSDYMSQHSIAGMSGISAGIDPDDAMNAYKTELIKQLDALLVKCQQMGSDAFGFGRYAVREFDTVEKWRQFDWKRHYPDMKVSWDIKLTEGWKQEDDSD